MPQVDKGELLILRILHEKNLHGPIDEHPIRIRPGEIIHFDHGLIISRGKINEESGNVCRRITTGLTIENVPETGLTIKDYDYGHVYPIDRLINGGQIHMSRGLIVFSFFWGQTEEEALKHYLEFLSLRQRNN